MGKVRQRIVKRIANELLEKFPEIFSTDFEVNKRFVDELTDIPSKSFRNRVAGYIAHLIRIKLAAEASESEGSEEEVAVEASK